MSSSVPVPAAEMTRSPDPQPPDPAVAAAPDAGRAPGLFGRARAAARPVSFASSLITVIVLLAGAVGGLVLRDLNSLDTAVGNLEADIAELRAEVTQLRADITQLRADVDEIDARLVKLETEMDARFVKLEADMDARFVKLETEMDARFVKLETEMDSRFVKLEAEMDARFDELETEMDARFDELEAGQQQIALTLTALVAYLRADEGVDSALSGWLLDPGADADEPRSAQPQADATAAGAGGSISGGRAPASTG